METDFARVTCPACFQEIEIPVPPVWELPAELDYDCEVCCRPMTLVVRDENGRPVAEARGPGE